MNRRQTLRSAVTFALAFSQEAFGMLRRRSSSGKSKSQISQSSWFPRHFHKEASSPGVVWVWDQNLLQKTVLSYGDFFHGFYSFRYDEDTSLEFVSLTGQMSPSVGILTRLRESRGIEQRHYFNRGNWDSFSNLAS